MKQVLRALLGVLATLLAGMALAAEQTITLAVDNMTCELCPITVKASLEDVPGVVKADVSYEQKTAVVTFDDAKANVADLINATTNAGYPSQVAAQ
jgi:periplasmic mercuric ion binding protein